MSRSIRSFAQSFQHDERGVVAVIFGLVATVVFVAAGLAIDVGRALHASTKIGTAVDAAAVAGVKGLRLQNMTDAEVRQVVQTYFDENLAEAGIEKPTITNFQVLIDRDKSSVELNVDSEVPTTLGQIAGINSINVPGRSVAIFEARDIEVGLQLDVTGSMRGSKIAALKVATKDLVDILIPDDSSLLGGRRIRIGYAPYAAGVNAGSFARRMNGGVSAPNNCVYERSSQGFQDADVFPSGSAVLKTRLNLPSARNCSSATLLPMTDNKNVLKSTVDSYSTGGSTAGHLGSAFAWYLLSPEWSSIWPTASRPEPYNDGKTMKVAILMTDGEYNTVGGTFSNGNKSRSRQFAIDTCSAMKAKGVQVYTVGFQLNQAAARSVMQSCASGTNKFYEATDGDALRNAFRSIAEDITRLRISE